MEQIIKYLNHFNHLILCRLSKFAHIRMYKFWLRPECTFKFSKLKQNQDKYLTIIRELTKYVIEERKKEFLFIKQEEIETGERPSKRPVFVDRFLEAKEDGCGLSDKDIMDEVMTMMFAVCYIFN